MTEAESLTFDGGRTMKKIMSIIGSMVLASFVFAGVYAGGTGEHSWKMKDKSYTESARPMDESYNEYFGETENPTERGLKDIYSIGKDVQTHEGEKLGTVRDFISDSQGNISLAIVSPEGSLNMEDRVAIPYDLLTFDETKGHFVADITEDQLAAAPRVDDEANLNDGAFAVEVYRHFGERPYWTEEGAGSNLGMEEGFESDTMNEGMEGGAGAGSLGESAEMGEYGY
jgi:hypothetical protein